MPEDCGIPGERLPLEETHAVVVAVVCAALNERTRADAQRGSVAHAQLGRQPAGAPVSDHKLSAVHSHHRPGVSGGRIADLHFPHSINQRGINNLDTVPEIRTGAVGRLHHAFVQVDPLHRDARRAPELARARADVADPAGGYHAARVREVALVVFHQHAVRVVHLIDLCAFKNFGRRTGALRQR